MSDFPRWKYALVALAMLFGVIYALPNAFPPVPAVQVTANRGAPPIDQSVQQKVSAALVKQKIAATEVVVSGDHLLATFADSDVQKSGSDAIKAALGENYTVAFKLQSNVPAWLGAIGARSMPLGLDLQGGVHFLMQVDQKDAIDKQENSYADDIRSLLRDKKIRYESVTRSTVEGKGIAVILRSSNDRSSASDTIANEYTDLNVSNGPSTGDRFVLNVVIKPEKLRELSRSAITQNLGTLRNRINALGVSEPLIQQQGDSRIVVELAGVQDPTEAKKLIGAVATLQYRPGIGQAGDARAQEAARTGNIPPDANLFRMRGSNLPVLVSKQIIVTGNQLTDASSGIDQQSGTPKVDVTLNAAGARKMSDFTNANVGKPMAVVYVERVYETKMVDGKQVRVPKV
ncbi:MAG: protein translocase subunit SecD, partial [Pseudomonadota bacterium]|nr:protein translocase subunit SecD [Pseudomonadota bacterium]